MVKTLYLILAIACVCSFGLGYRTATNIESLNMYHRDYKECIKELPRNKDCVAVKIIFKEIDDE